MMKQEKIYRWSARLRRLKTRNVLPKINYEPIRLEGSFLQDVQESLLQKMIERLWLPKEAIQGASFARPVYHK